MADVGDQCEHDSQAAPVSDSTLGHDRAENHCGRAGHKQDDCDVATPRGDQEVCETQLSIVVSDHEDTEAHVRNVRDEDSSYDTAALAGDRTTVETQPKSVASDQTHVEIPNRTVGGDQMIDDAQATVVASEEGRVPVYDEIHGGHDSLLLELREAHWRRQSFQRMQTVLTNKTKGMCRRLVAVNIPELDYAEIKTEGLKLWNAMTTDPDSHPLGVIAHGACLPLLLARDQMHEAMLGPQLRMRKLAHQLPVWPWAEKVHGFGDIGLAQIIAEAGDLSKYSNPAKLWKRMGLGMVEVDGEWSRQRRVSGAAALKHGYAPRRRAIMHVIGDSIMRATRNENPYREVYLEKKEFYREKWPEESKMHVHMAALRYMEKRLLKDLWVEWRRTTPQSESKCQMSVSLNHQ